MHELKRANVRTFTVPRPRLGYVAYLADGRRVPFVLSLSPGRPPESPMPSTLRSQFENTCMRAAGVKSLTFCYDEGSRYEIVGVRSVVTERKFGVVISRTDKLVLREAQTPTR